MVEAKSVERLSHYATSIGLIYVLIGLLSSLYLAYLQVYEMDVPAMLEPANESLLCLSIIILIVGVAMSGWARYVAEKRFSLTGGLMMSAQASVALLALGAITNFLSAFLEIPEAGLIGLVGYALYIIGFLVVTVGWIIGGSRLKTA